MSLSHHAEEHNDNRLRELFRQQESGTAPRQWPNGRLCGDDDGEIAFEVGAAPGLITVRFPKPVATLGMTPQDAVKFAQLLIRQARTVATEPLRIVLH